MEGRMDQDAKRAGRWGGGSAQCAPPSPGRNHDTTTTPCRAPAARRARGAERERAHSRSKRRRVRAVRPGLKTYRKSSPPGTSDTERQTRNVRHGTSDTSEMVPRAAARGSAPCSWLRWPSTGFLPVRLRHSRYPLLRPLLSRHHVL
jgi:hypothetical protein